MSTDQTMQTCLEELEVGQQFFQTAGPLTGGNGADVAATYARLQLGIAGGQDLEARWRYLSPVREGAELRFEATVTRCRRTSSLEQGLVGRHVRVLDSDGMVVQEGQTLTLVPARVAQDDGATRVGRAFGSREWAAAMANRLGADCEFTTQTSTWDGALGIRFGADEIQFRIYRGRVLEAVRRTLAGPTFVVEASEHDWVDLFTGSANDFARRAMLDQFEVHGNAYEYLRMTAALVAFVDQARALAGAGRSN